MYMYAQQLLSKLTTVNLLHEDSYWYGYICIQRHFSYNRYTNILYACISTMLSLVLNASNVIILFYSHL